MGQQPFIILPATGNDPADEWVRIATEAHTGNRLPDAERHYRRAIGLSPCHAIATHNLAILFQQMNQLPEALLAMDRAILFDPSSPLMHANRAFMFLEADRIDEALEAAAEAMELSPRPPRAGDELAKQGYLSARLATAMISATAGYPDRALPAYQEMLAVEPKHPFAGTNACFISSLMDIGPEKLREPRQLWREIHGYKGAVWPHGNSREPDRPLRVGYVGGDFKNHSAAMMFSHVLWNHTPAVVPYFYSSLPVNPEADNSTMNFMLAAGRLKVNPDDGPPLLVADGHRWRDIHGLTDEAVDDMIRKDGIDILVDLAGHTNGGRLGVFDRKPAPVQVTAWGFAHGTYLSKIDHFFADPVAIPEAERQHYAEQIYDLPCIVTYRPPVEYGLKATSPAPCFSNDYVTFGSYSRFEKLSDKCLATMREILNRVPNSRLYLKDHSFRRPYSIKRVRRAMPDIDPSRLMFGISSAHPEHMASYHACDLFLDPFPHGAGVVTLECLYMSVPIVTLYGPQASGRTASSVLTTLGRTDWIARTPEEYVEKAVEMVGKPHELAAARRTLRDELLNSPVVKDYHLAVEAAYRAIWRKWCASPV